RARHRKGADDRANLSSAQEVGKSVFSSPPTTQAPTETGSTAMASKPQTAADSANSVASGDVLRRVVAIPHWLDGPPSDRRDLRKSSLAQRHDPLSPVQGSR